jgi:hypothetical protein
MNDPGTAARAQNRPNVPQGAEADVVVPGSAGHSKSASTLSTEDWDLIEETGRGINGAIFPLQNLLLYRDQTLRRRAEALRDRRSGFVDGTVVSSRRRTVWAIDR